MFRSLRPVLAFAVIVAVSALLASCSDSDSGSASTTPATPTPAAPTPDPSQWIPSPGDSGVLSVGGPNDLVVVAVSDKALGDCISALAAHDDVGIQKLEDSGDLYTVSDQTGFKFLGFGDGMFNTDAHIRIADGSHAGDDGWVPIGFVKRATAAPAPASAAGASNPLAAPTPEKLQSAANGALLGLWEDDQGRFYDEAQAQAVTRGQVKAALDGGADVNAKDSTGWTALMYAANGGNLRCVKFLLSRGADVNAQDNNGYTAMWHADITNKPKCVAALKAAGGTE